MTTDDTPTNSTPQDDLVELDKLLVKSMIEGLKAEAPRASLLAVVERYLGARKAAMKPPPRMFAPGPVPFPRLDPDAYSTAKPDRVDAMRTALQVPFKADGDASQT